MKRILWNLILAAVATALTFASCQRPGDIDRDTITGRAAIDLMSEGERYEKEGNYKMALDKYNKALDQSPSPAIYYHMGVCYNALGEYAKAQESLNTAVRMAGDYPAAQYLLSKVRIQAMLVARQGKTGAATSARPTLTATPGTAAGSATPPAPVVAITATPRTTPREVAEMTRTPVRPESKVRTPTRVVITPTPRATVAPTPAAVERTPVPIERTPTSLATEQPAVSPSNPVVMPPPASVEAISTPRPTPRTTIIGAPTPAPKTSLPQVPLDAIFPPTSVEDLSSTSTAAPRGVIGATTETGTLLSQWQFHWEQAKSFLDRHMDQEAVDELLQVLGSQVRHLDARLELADAYDRLGSGAKAVEQYEKARVFWPSEAKPYFRTGNYFLRHAKDNPTYYDRARTYYFTAINVNPKYFFAYHNVGVSYMEQGNYESAKTWFEKALAVKPDYASAHRNLGLLYDQHLNNPKEAIRHYREYIRLGGPDTAEVNEWLKALEEAK